MKTSDTVAHRILLIGDIDRAFSDTDAVSKLSCEVYADMRDAISAAAKNSFATIAVVMSGLSGKLESALRTLRQANCSARIVLLVQMLEEPLAMQLVGQASDGTSAADDYLICPIEASKFYESVVHPNGKQAAEAGAAAIADTTAVVKIKQLEKLATEDDLTGLKNRRYIWEFSRQIMDYTKKKGGMVTLLIFDIDNFKHYNDVYGHPAGDKVLKQAAVLIRRCCRQHDVVGRIGGDEFAVVFWDDPRRKSVDRQAERRSTTVNHPKEAIFIAERFRKELENAELHLLGPTGKGILAISGGLASFPRDGSTIEELFQQADKALLEAKRSGKNKIYLVGEANSDIAEIE
ncbi:MAG: diguanylate cyclase [Planctomycetota bacterium]|jgi:PleD family two-component response regulator